MINGDLTQNCPDELLLWIDNDRYLAQEWRKTIRTGNLNYILDAFDSAGLKYRKDQWEAVIDEFEDEMKQNEEALAERNTVRDMHGFVVEGA